MMMTAMSQRVLNQKGVSLPSGWGCRSVRLTAWRAAAFRRSARTPHAEPRLSCAPLHVSSLRALCVLRGELSRRPAEERLPRQVGSEQALGAALRREHPLGGEVAAAHGGFHGGGPPVLDPV